MQTSKQRATVAELLQHAWICKYTAAHQPPDQQTQLKQPCVSDRAASMDGTQPVPAVSSTEGSSDSDNNTAATSSSNRGSDVDACLVVQPPASSHEPCNMDHTTFDAANLQSQHAAANNLAAGAGDAKAVRLSAETAEATGSITQAGTFTSAAVNPVVNSSAPLHLDCTMAAVHSDQQLHSMSADETVVAYENTSPTSKHSAGGGQRVGVRFVDEKQAAAGSTATGMSASVSTSEALRLRVPTTSVDELPLLPSLSSNQGGMENTDPCPTDRDRCSCSGQGRCKVCRATGHGHRLYKQYYPHDKHRRSSYDNMSWEDLISTVGVHSPTGSGNGAMPAGQKSHPTSPKEDQASMKKQRRSTVRHTEDRSPPSSPTQACNGTSISVTGRAASVATTSSSRSSPFLSTSEQQQAVSGQAWLSSNAAEPPPINLDDYIAPQHTPLTALRSMGLDPEPLLGSALVTALSAPLPSSKQELGRYSSMLQRGAALEDYIALSSAPAATLQSLGLAYADDLPGSKKAGVVSDGDDGNDDDDDDQPSMPSLHPDRGQSANNQLPATSGVICEFTGTSSCIHDSAWFGTDGGVTATHDDDDVSINSSKKVSPRPPSVPHHSPSHKKHNRHHHVHQHPHHPRRHAAKLRWQTGEYLFTQEAQDSNSNSSDSNTGMADGAASTITSVHGEGSAATASSMQTGNQQATTAIETAYNNRRCGSSTGPNLKKSPIIRPSSRKGLDLPATSRPELLLSAAEVGDTPYSQRSSIDIGSTSTQGLQYNSDDLELLDEPEQQVGVLGGCRVQVSAIGRRLFSDPDNGSALAAEQSMSGSVSGSKRVVWADSSILSSSRTASGNMLAQLQAFDDTISSTSTNDNLFTEVSQKLLDSSFQQQPERNTKSASSSFNGSRRVSGISLSDLSRRATRRDSGSPRQDRTLISSTNGSRQISKASSTASSVSGNVDITQAADMSDELQSPALSPLQRQPSAAIMPPTGVLSDDTLLPAPRSKSFTSLAGMSLGPSLPVRPTSLTDVWQLEPGGGKGAAPSSAVTRASISPSRGTGSSDTATRGPKAAANGRPSSAKGSKITAAAAAANAARQPGTGRSVIATIAASNMNHTPSGSSGAQKHGGADGPAAKSISAWGLNGKQGRLSLHDDGADSLAANKRSINGASSNVKPQSSSLSYRHTHSSSVERRRRSGGIASLRSSEEDDDACSNGSSMPGLLTAKSRSSSVGNLLLRQKLLQTRESDDDTVVSARAKSFTDGMVQSAAATAVGVNAHAAGKPRLTPRKQLIRQTQH